MGMKGKLTKAFEFIYKAKLNNDLTEHEHDTVFIGVSDNLPKINLNEVSDFAYISINDLEIDIEKNSDKYTFWLKACFKNFKQYSDSLINKD
jgi:isopentenyl-diphosphate delta-isomerase